MRMRIVAAASTISLAAGCLGPLVSDEPGSSLHILPPGAPVPHVTSNADLNRQIRVNDGLSDMALETAGGVVKLKSGWAEGVKVSYWDFGDTVDRGALLYRLMRREGDGEDAALVPIDHPWVIDSLPGDAGYSPYWMVQDLVVTERYAGEVLPSARAVADAIDLGLVEEPVPAMLYVDGPIVPYGTQLDMGADQPTGRTLIVLAHGYRVDMMAIGGAEGALRKMDRAGRIPRGDVHRIKQENATNPIKEVTFQNLSMPWTPNVRLIDCRVTMPEDPMDPSATISDESMLFERDMMGNMTAQTDRVLEWKVGTTVKNWPILVEAAP